MRHRSSRFDIPEAVLCFTIASTLSVATGLRLSRAVLHGALVDPDSYMRLVRLRDMVDRGTPLHAVARDASGDGAVMSWSHLLDSLMLLLALPLRPFTTPAVALHGAALALGPLEVGLLGAAAAWALAPLAERRWRWTAPVLAGLAPPIVTYGMPGVAHHHVLAALVAVMLAGTAGRAAHGGQGASQEAGREAGRGRAGRSAHGRRRASGSRRKRCRSC